MTTLWSKVRPGLCVLLCLWAADIMQAQMLHVVNPGPGSVALDGPWRFHTGDDTRWADPGFDDQRWPLVRVDAPWGAQGYGEYAGFAWYRLKLQIGPQPRDAETPLSLWFPSVDDHYAVYLDGKEIGHYGGFPPKAHLRNASPGSIFPLPTAAGAPGLLAVRVWKSQLASNDPLELGGLQSAPVLGSRPVLEAMQGAVVSSHDHMFVTREMLSTVILVTGFLSLLLYVRGSRDPVYLCLAVYLLADASSALLSTLFWFQMSFMSMQLINAARVTACNLALWYLLLYVLDLVRVATWWRLTGIMAATMIATQVIDTGALALWQFNSAALRWLDGTMTVIYAVLPAYMFVLLYAGLRRRTRIGIGPLVAGITAYGLYNVVIESGNQANRYTGLQWPHAVDAWTLSVLGYPIGVRSLLDAGFVVTLLITLVRFYAADRARRAALELELESAREIQRVLVPDQLPEVPGITADAVYRPAHEVGGDFFQLLPTPSGGVLVVVGDVSGKGLKAAMMVSLIVGAVHALAEGTASPAVLLTGINRRLIGRSAGGFTTCLVLTITPSGRVEVANAGHLPPFLNGSELSLEGSLPLGVDEEPGYVQSTFQLVVGDRLTLYTDGLLEARNTSGELFGFDRVGTLVRQRPSADEMAQAAMLFGQEDDITLLTLTRTR